MAEATISLEARADFAEAWAYLAAYNLDAADRFLFLDDFWTGAELHAKFPRTGRPRDDLRPDLRSFVVGRHVAFFQPDASGIRIVRVLHGSRDLEQILRGE